MMDATGWALDGLAAEHGAQTIYRVTRERGDIRLEGRAGSRTCLLRSESPAATAGHLLASTPSAIMISKPAGPALLTGACCLPMR